MAKKSARFHNTRLTTKISKVLGRARPPILEEDAVDELDKLRPIYCPLTRDRPKGTPGRKPLLTGELRLRFLAMIEVGGRKQDAAALCLLDMQVVRKELKKDKAFAAAVLAAEKKGKSYFLGRIFRHAGSDWRAAAWWLERRFRVEWGRQFSDKDYDTKPVHVDLQFGDGQKVTARLPSGVQLMEREIGHDSPGGPKSVRTLNWKNRRVRKDPEPEEET